MANDRQDVYTRVTAAIIADLERGVRPWVKPWTAGNGGDVSRPLRNTGIAYRDSSRGTARLQELTIKEGATVMKTYTVKHTVACYVTFTFRVNAVDSDDAVDQFARSGGDFVRHELGETLECHGHSSFHVIEGDPFDGPDGRSREPLLHALRRAVSALERTLDTSLNHLNYFREDSTGTPEECETIRLWQEEIDQAVAAGAVIRAAIAECEAPDTRRSDDPALLNGGVLAAALPSNAPPTDVRALPTREADQYPGATEIVRGVFVDPGAAVYIVDEQGEVTSWNHEEIVVEPSGFTAALTAVIIAATHGAFAVRENIATGGAVLDLLIERTRRAGR